MCSVFTFVQYIMYNDDYTVFHGVIMLGLSWRDITEYDYMCVKAHQSCSSDDTFVDWNRCPLVQLSEWSYLNALGEDIQVRILHLTLSQTTNFRRFETERVCRRQFQKLFKEVEKTFFFFLDSFYLYIFLECQFMSEANIRYVQTV